MKKTRRNMDELAVAKMQKMDEEIKSGKRKAYTLEEVRKKYGF
jgi:acetyl-CoA acetyltransferase